MKVISLIFVRKFITLIGCKFSYKKRSEVTDILNSGLNTFHIMKKFLMVVGRLFDTFIPES